MKVLIVDTLASGLGQRKTTLDVIGAGPRSIFGVLENKGIKTKITTAGLVITGLAELIEYDLLLLSGMTSDITAIRHVVSRWRKSSNGPIIIGGPVSSSPEDALIKAGGNLAVIGEGEQTLQELIDLGLSGGQLPPKEYLSRVLGIAYLENGAVKVTGLRPVMKRKNYNRLTPSTRTIRDYPLYYAARVYVEILRGCSNYLRAKIKQPVGTCASCSKCATGPLEQRYDCPLGLPPGCGYCSVPSLYGPPKSRSVGKIRAEVEGLLDQGVRRIVLSAPDFLDYGRDLLVEPEPLTDPRHPEPNYEEIEELLSRLTGIKDVQENEASIMLENLKCSLVTERAAELLGRYLAGTPMSIGFETGSESHSTQLGRPSTPRETLRAIALLRKAGLKPYVYFIHGLPGQTVETASESVKAIGKSVQAGAARIIMYRFQSLPMSAFHEQPSAPPAVREPLSKSIHDAALKANRALKEDYIGKTLRVVVAEPYERDKRLYVAYPMLHGPVVLLEGFKGLEGRIMDVVVSGVVSDRMVRGRTVDASL